MTALVWLGTAIALAIAEILSGDLFLLMLGGGAAVTAASAFALDVPVVAQALIFAVSSILLVAGLRPILLRRLRVAPTPSGVEHFAGRDALVLEAITAHAGQIKVDGEVWTARPAVDSDSYESGATVEIMRIDGATAIVWKGE